MPATPIRPALSAGLAYFAWVFALGFVLGTVRTLFVADAPGGQGRLVGVLIELPIMLAASWFACGRLVQRFRVPPTRAARVAMGGVALACLLLAEMAVGVWLFGRSVPAHLALYRDPSYAIGLGAQLAFAALPLLRMRGAGARA